MESEEIHAEVARRKKRGEELKIRETLCVLHGHFCDWRAWLGEDLGWIYPEVRRTLEFAVDQPKFTPGNATFEIISLQEFLAHITTPQGWPTL
jgi:hypothetical protein